MKFEQDVSKNIFHGPQSNIEVVPSVKRCMLTPK